MNFSFLYILIYSWLINNKYNLQVRRLKDQHIAARIAQFNGNTEGIDVEQCDVVKEYLESGRADEIEHSTEGGCTQLEVSRQFPHAKIDSHPHKKMTPSRAVLT